ncbi:hypothetical protein MKX72_20340 [Priestia sp. FSL R5-0597]|uniref:hypothetical protein n=1 Tax=Priestia sp. FSL R5-0597 TaxID=2921580 RepID=UPI0030FD1E60
MGIITNYLWDKWDEEGVVPARHIIEEDLQDLISHDQALSIPAVVSGFMQRIIPAEGVIHYNASSEEAEE